MSGPTELARSRPPEDASGERAPVFVVGVARSGTTLLAALLSGHSRLDAGPESRFFARLRHLDRAARARLTDPGGWPGPATDFIGSLSNQGHPVVGLFGLTLADIRTWLASRAPSIAAMLESLTVQHAERRGKSRWVEKTPRHLLEIPALRASWPGAYLVRIVRDPRDVALSLAAMPFAGGTLVSNLVRVDADDRASRDAFTGDARALTVRYEDLVSEPERELRRLCEAIGEAFEPRMLEPGASGGEVAGEHEWWKAGVAGPLDATRVGRWRREMPEPERRFAAIHLAGYLREHRYEGARAATGIAAVVPVGTALGPRNDGLLLDLARRDLAVARPTPTEVRALAACDEIAFVGARGQLDPFRGSAPLAHALGLLRLAALLGRRRLAGRPARWLARATRRTRRRNGPGELATLVMLGLLARRDTIGGQPRPRTDGSAGA
jgi:hypothetical protein